MKLDQQLRAAIAKLRSPADVYEIRLEDGEKPVTIRQRLLLWLRAWELRSLYVSTATALSSGS
jgi:hypothetical protein